MKLFRYFLILAVIIFFWSPFALCLEQKTIEESRAIALSDWSVEARPSIVDMLFNKVSYEHFMAIIESEPGLRKIFLKDIDFEKPVDLYLMSVGDYTWNDIDANGIYEFLGIMIVNRGYDRFYIVKRIDEQFSIQVIGVCFNKDYIFENKKITDMIKDLDHDGKGEIIIPVPESENSFVSCWPTIYKWNGKKFEDASETFEDYYRDVILPKEEKHILKLQAEIKKEHSERHINRTKNHAESTRNELDDLDINEIELAQHQIIRDKIIRFVGQDSRAGFERAKEWAKSPYVYLRRNAIVVLGDIKDEESISELEKLCLDPELSVAGNAQSVLKKMREKKQ